MLANLFSQILDNKTVFRKVFQQKGRKLSLEWLENRELLSVSPLLPSSIETEYYVESQCFVNTGSSAEEILAAAASAAPYHPGETFFLHSNPSSRYTIYLDFDGHLTTGTQWNSSYTGGSAIVTPPFSLDADPAFSDMESERIQYIWQRVAEDFAPFDVDVTTEEPDLDRLIKSGAGDTDWGIRIAIGGNSSDWYGNSVGGIAYTGSFTNSTDTPAFVFPKNLSNGVEKNVAEAISHEVGHTLGLSHDGTSTQSYYSGANGWAPVMGNSYHQNVTQWSKGEYPNANNHEDDLAIITKYIPYKADDHANDISSVTESDRLKWDTDSTPVTMTGIIETNTDIDVFRFTTDTNSVVNFNIISGTRDANLDISVTLSKENDPTFTTLIQNDTNTLNAYFTDIELTAGTYYLSIEGTDKPGVYSDYASIGTYTISGSLTRLTVPTNVTNLRVTQQAQTALSLAWNKVEGAAGYILQRQETSGTEFVTIYNGTDSRYVDRGLTPDTSYTYRVQAIDSAFPAEISAKTEAKIVSGKEVTDSPMILSAMIENNEAAVTWTDLGSDYHYLIYKDAQLVVNLGSSASYVDSNPSGTTTYSVYAYNDRLKKWSWATPTVVTTTAPKIEITGHEILPDGNIRLTWNGVGTNYMVYQSGFPASGMSYLKTTDWTDTKPLADNQYQIYASYVDPADNKIKWTWSNIYFVTKTAAAPSASSLDAFWAEYNNSVVDDDVLNGIVY